MGLSLFWHPAYYAFWIFVSSVPQDEADILGDRIAIMAEGQLRCVGSSLFLKKTYGVGYHLTIEKQPANFQKASSAGIYGTEDNGRKMGRGGNPTVDEKLKEIVLGSVSEGSLLSCVGSEISFQLPLGASSNFSSIFETLDEKVDKGEIVTYGVGITTLDEVFLMVARGASTEKQEFTSSQLLETSSVPVGNDDCDTRSAHSGMDLENDGLFARHVGALFRKRAVNFKRDKRAWLCTTVLPSLFVLVGFLLYKFVSSQVEYVPLTLELNDYNTGEKTKPTNPIPFNKPRESYTCQPGKCAYDFSVVSNNATDELYYFCGVQAFLGANLTCSITDSEMITSRITEAGAVAEGASVSNVNEVRANGQGQGWGLTVVI